MRVKDVKCQKIFMEVKNEGGGQSNYLKVEV